MPTNLKRISFYAEPELVELLERWHAETGAPISEIVRRVLKTRITPDLCTPDQKKMLFRPQMETRNVQPTLLTHRAGEEVR